MAREEISFPADGRQLSGTIFRPTAGGEHPAVLVMHGWSVDQSRMHGFAEKLTEEGYITMTFDFPGHGASEGDIQVHSRAEYVSAAAAAYDYLAHLEGVDSRRIIAGGTSFGGHVSALLSGIRPLHALFMRAPSDYPDDSYEKSNYEIADALYEGASDPALIAWKTALHPWEELASLRSLHAFEGPVLIIESENDELVPHGVIQSYMDAVADPAKLTHVVMEGAPHSITRRPELQALFTETVQNWLREKAA